MRESIRTPIAGIDFGSNSLRLAVARGGREEGFEIIHRERAPLRLANDAFRYGVLSQDTMEALVDVSEGFALAMDEQGVESYRAVGTEALRRASNSDDAVDIVGKRVGVSIEIMSVEEETALVLEAVEFSSPGCRPPVVVVDLGGGSLEIIEPPAEGRGVRFESHALGLASRFEQFLASRAEGLETREELNALAARTVAELDSDLLGSVQGGGSVVFTGGQARMLDHLAVDWGMWSEERSRSEGVSRDAFADLLRKVTERGPGELMSMGVPGDRAPMLAAAASVYLAVSEMIVAASIRLPRTGLMEGILLSVPLRGREWR